LDSRKRIKNYLSKGNYANLRIPENADWRACSIYPLKKNLVNLLEKYRRKLKEDE